MLVLNISIKLTIILVLNISIELTFKNNINITYKIPPGATVCQKSESCSLDDDYYKYESKIRVYRVRY